ncbi:uncharacterized protein LOC106095284 isoform X2 [Stomoxys calcitrans]|uniref:uncharacterized protein LOC106095284 isoform X2 n=1 Tax=Stomoxys calcitrans TaxID=35570 RepID=UPI0027E2F9D3|nr:uncharacterized protein LOC106095284 isoform X2 [Stomoxys calcitrans]
MMSWKYLISVALIAIWIKLSLGDIVVQLNINRPVNDVSDKFVSFTMKPEDLYEALDGSHRKSITRMASMLDHSHIKFVGDYYFASETNTKLRNPTKIVWKGFNKWTRAMDWSMIIPVPYTPNDWDPMHAFKILNNSQAVGITDCIWQLGTDFGTSAASDYVNDMKTFNLMVESFRETDTNWQIMGADISSGSSPDETKEYVQMSKDLNTAFGWIGSSDSFLGNSLTSAFNEHDPALKVLFKEKVPVWLTLLKTFNPSLSFMDDEEVQEGLNWAQTMGDAAHNGFDVIFKPVSLSDWESPKYSFYVTAVYKKVMGSRVFAAKPLSGFFGRSNKLYTHCANSESGGLAFMVINKQTTPLQITVRSMSKLKDNEVWQYALTMSDGQVMLNNKQVSINSTLEPEIKRKQSNSFVQLKTPASSVSFWVLPNANVEHCQYTEVDSSMSTSTEDESQESTEKIKRYTSSDRLLKELIKEAAAKTAAPAGRKKYRHRRSVDSKNEQNKKFFLGNGALDSTGVFKTLTEAINTPFKREAFSPERRQAAMKWLGKLFREPLNANLPLLRRSARNSDTYNGPFFMTRDGKKTAFTKKVTDIKKPEKKTNKRTFEDLEFDEEKFFKNVGVQTEPDYVKFPEGDVFLQNIDSVNGEDVADEELKIQHVKKVSSKKEPRPKLSKDIVNEMKPLRLLPTEFYESLPVNPSKSSVDNKPSTGSPFNSLGADEPLNKVYSKGKSNLFSSYFDKHDEGIASNIDEQDNSEPAESNADSANDSADEFAQAQMKMSEKNFKNSAVEDDKEVETSKDVDDILVDSESMSSTTRKSRFSNFMKDSFLGTSDGDEDETDSTAHESEPPTTKAKFDELPWWDLTSSRSKRSLDTAESWHDNMVSKDEDPIVAANEISPSRLRAFEYKVDEAVRSTGKSENDIDTISKKFVKTFKSQVTKIVDIVSQHVNEWYNSMSKQLENTDGDDTNDI